LSTGASVIILVPDCRWVASVRKPPRYVVSIVAIIFYLKTNLSVNFNFLQIRRGNNVLLKRSQVQGGVSWFANTNY
jgi:hypothetical protein